MSERTALGRQARWASLLSPLVAAVALLWGFGDLAAGGMTVAPVLLVFAYVAAIPVALLLGGVGARR